MNSLLCHKAATTSAIYKATLSFERQESQGVKRKYLYPIPYISAHDFMFTQHLVYCLFTPNDTYNLQDAFNL